MLREHQLLERAGLPGSFLDYRRLLDIFGIGRAGAIVSPGAADADPVQLARGLLGYDAATHSVGVQLKNGRQARSVVLATGYVMPAPIQSTLQKVSSSWATATTPQPRNIWKGGVLIWEDSKTLSMPERHPADELSLAARTAAKSLNPRRVTI